VKISTSFFLNTKKREIGGDRKTSA